MLACSLKVLSKRQYCHKTVFVAKLSLFMGTGEAKAAVMKKLVQYVLSDDVQSNASAFNYASMSPDTVRPCFWISRVVTSV